MLAFEHPHLGRLVQPRHFPKVAETAGRGVPWAADNDAFLGFDAERFERMLHALVGLPGCLFVTCPDIVGEGGLTDIHFEEWAPRIMRHGLPLAYVVQEEGLEYEWGGVPWGAIAALFVGGACDEERSASASAPWSPRPSAAASGSSWAASTPPSASPTQCDRLRLGRRDQVGPLARHLSRRRSGTVSVSPQLALGVGPEAIAR